MTNAGILVANRAGVVAPAASKHAPSPFLEEPAHCRPGALTDSYGLLVQAVLALFAFGTLSFKRFLEPKATRRPWLVWFFDVSKQGFGAFVIHFLNVFLADLFAGDPCTYYVVSYLLDCTIGLVIVWIGVKTLTAVGHVKRWETLRFGDYGSPRPRCRYWRNQCAAFVGVSVIEKICVVVIIQFDFWRNVRRLILKPVEWLEMPKLEVTLVVLIIPLAMNTLIFWVVDNITKKKSKSAPSSSHSRSASRGVLLPLFAKLMPGGGGGSSSSAEDNLDGGLAGGGSGDGRFFGGGGGGSKHASSQELMATSGGGDAAEDDEKQLLLMLDDNSNQMSPTRLLANDEDGASALVQRRDNTTRPVD